MAHVHTTGFEKLSCFMDECFKAGLVEFAVLGILTLGLIAIFHPLARG